jgi:macrolide transport system ATP-binding/permease protein
MSIWKKLTYLVPSNRRAAERDIQEELESLEEIAGRRELGNLTLAAEDARSELTWLSVERLGQDVRYGLRSMVRDKVFAVLVVASLALGIGANTAIYSFVDSILLRPLPVTDPASLVVMKWHAQGYALASSGMSWSTGGSSFDPATGTLSSIFPYPALKLFQDRDDVLSSAFCYFVADKLSITLRDATDSVMGQYVSGNYFMGMGVTAAAGRLIHVSDDAVESSAVAVVSHGFSLRRFGDPQAAVGQTIRINDQPFVIIGVVPQSFFGAEPGATPDVYVPMHAASMPLHYASMQPSVYSDEHYYWIEIMARLKPGVSLARAQAALAPAFVQFASSSATTEKQKQDLPQLRIQEGATGLDSLRRRYAQPIYVLMAMVALMLIIACTNVANLLLVRGAARRREIAVRLSVGASRWRVIRQLLTESVLLSSVGGVFGLAFAWWGIRVLTRLLANGRENFTLHAELNWHVLGVTMTLSILTGLLFGLAPALQATRVDIAPSLKDARDTSRPSRRFSLGWILVVIQVAFSLVLLVSAGLFSRTLSTLHTIELGFNRDHVLLFTIRPSSVGYTGPALTRLFGELQERIRQLPGVREVSLSGRPLPMGGGTMAPVVIAGAITPASPVLAVLASVGPGFFRTMEIPLVAGRDFTEGDGANAPRVAVVNRRLTRVWGIENPIGRTVTLGKDRFEIVGVAEDALSFKLKEDRRPAIYFPYLQSTRPPGQMTYEIRTVGDPLALAGTVRDTVRQVDSRIAIHDLKTQAAHIDQAISTEITLARLCSVFAALALVIACVGLYGTVAFNVARRTNEIGIRTALGASATRIIWMVLRDVCTMAAAGLAIGIPLVLAGSRYVKAFLYGVAPNDPGAIAIAVGVLLASGLLASFIPARRASRIDPLGAMRCE